MRTLGRTSEIKRRHQTTTSKDVKKTTTMAPKAKKWKWKASLAKEELRKAIVDGWVTDEMSLDEIFLTVAELALTNRTKLSSRLAAVRKQIIDDAGAAASDEAAMAHDRALFPAPTHNYRGEPRWEGSVAQSFLRLDVSSGKHLAMDPKKFYESRIEYTRDYSLVTIRQHIYQEIKFVKFCRFRNDKAKTQFREL
jgi:hypothetical protein